MACNHSNREHSGGHRRFQGSIQLPPFQGCHQVSDELTRVETRRPPGGQHRGHHHRHPQCDGKMPWYLV